MTRRHTTDARAQAGTDTTMSKSTLGQESAACAIRIASQKVDHDITTPVDIVWGGAAQSRTYVACGWRQHPHGAGTSYLRYSWVSKITQKPRIRIDK